jgi:deazaflavin-dependent oxidoreductase (nitroreductase family)
MSIVASPPGSAASDHSSAPPSPGAPPALPAPPDASRAMAAVTDLSRTAFRYGNRWFMVPLHRAGLAAWLGTPLTGCQLLLTTVGARTGRRRSTPLGYLVADGAAWVVAGYGPATLWYRNLLADPAVEVLLPGRPPLPALAEEVLDPTVRARIIPPLVRSMRLPGTMIGSDPGTASDARILELMAWVPLIRLRPDGPPLVAGPDDPGGLGWLWRQGLLVALTVAGVVALRRVRSSASPRT